MSRLPTFQYIPGTDRVKRSRNFTTMQFSVFYCATQRSRYSDKISSTLASVTANQYLSLHGFQLAYTVTSQLHSSHLYSCPTQLQTGLSCHSQWPLLKNKRVYSHASGSVRLTCSQCRCLERIILIMFTVLSLKFDGVFAVQPYYSSFAKMSD